MNFGQARALYQILSAEFPHARAQKLPNTRDPPRVCQCLQYLLQSFGLHMSRRARTNRSKGSTLRLFGDNEKFLSSAGRPMTHKKDAAHKRSTEIKSKEFATTRTRSKSTRSKRHKLAQKQLQSFQSPHQNLVPFFH